ncbi:twin-arginine translocation signal domain-containing protein [Halobellus sp. GM3]|uniref:twin-arginine translocation signal domain-containing protein n=1 Tax=Halobellus sp. GM3 TaxID=3458410 RepID=UPI00403DC36E
MDDSILQDRRRFLGGLGVGGGLLLAGCTEQLSPSDEAREQVDEGGDETASGVAAIAAVDQEGMQEEQARLREELQSGNLSREEAQEELVSLQESYLNEAMDALSGTLEAQEGVTVDEEYRSLGAVTVSGDAGAILSVLDSEDVSAFVAKADVESRVQTQETPE